MKQIPVHLLWLPFLSTAFLLPSCDKKEKEEVASEVVDFQDDDAAMNKAIADARAHVDVFLEALKKAEPGRSFAVKKPFKLPGGGAEHMWLVDVKFVDGEFEGRLDNVPRDATNVAPGKRYAVPINEISDWNIMDKHMRIWGNYTLRVTLPRLPPEDRIQFEKMLQPLP